MNGRARGLVIDLRAVRDPVAIGDLADEQAATPESSMLHARRLGGSMPARSNGKARALPAPTFDIAS
jgi:hypothetical protein